MNMRNTRRIAAAVLGMIAVAGVIAWLTISNGGANIAFADIATPLIRAHTATFTLTRMNDGIPGGSAKGMAMEPGMQRLESDNQVTITNVPEKTLLMLLSETKTGFLLRWEYMSESATYEGFNTFEGFRRRIEQALAVDEESVEFLGEREIGGVTAIGYRVEKYGYRTTLWSDSDTKLPLQVELVKGTVSVTFDDIVLDVDLDESLFAMDIPEGYTVRESTFKRPTINDVAVLFRVMAIMNDGKFPALPEESGMKPFWEPLNGFHKVLGLDAEEAREMSKSIGRGIQFLTEMHPGGHYAGKGVNLGDAEKAIFWYKPEGSETYKVIYGDLRVEDVAEEGLPTQP